MMRTADNYLLFPTNMLTRSLKPVAKRLAIAINAENYNLLQNNGRLAHQVVDHVSTM